MRLLDRLKSAMRRRSSVGVAEHGNRTRKRRLYAAGAVLLAIFLGFYAVSVYWSEEPALFDVDANAKAMAKSRHEKLVTGYVTTATLIRVANTLLDKPGGYLSNDVTPPSVFMDDMPSWEFGVLIQVRDLARSLRNDMSRSRSQSLEDPDLAVADPQFNFQNDSWMFPSTEGEYRKGIRALDRYLAHLSDPSNQTAQFYARADNLRDWLGVVNKRLGNLSQRLAASVGQYRVNTDLANDPNARQSTRSAGQLYTKTPWMQVDDVFYEARGSTWALIEFLKAAEIDFHGILQKKNALVSLQQIIRELEVTQRPISSPMVLNGDTFGIFANYSLTMASAIARANAAIIDLRALLAQG